LQASARELRTDNERADRRKDQVKNCIASTIQSDIVAILRLTGDYHCLNLLVRRKLKNV
jgi:hypothetical protein